MKNSKHTQVTAPGPSHITEALHGQAEERLAEPDSSMGGDDSPKRAANVQNAQREELGQRDVNRQVNDVIEKGE